MTGSDIKREKTFTEETQTTFIYKRRLNKYYTSSAAGNYESAFVNTVNGDFVYFQNDNSVAKLIMGNYKAQTSTTYKGKGPFSYFHHVTPDELEKLNIEGFPENIQQYAMICSHTFKPLYEEENQFFEIDHQTYTKLDVINTLVVSPNKFFGGEDTYCNIG